MNKTEILNIVNEPSKHIQIVKIDGKDSIVYSSKFVELLELIPTMLTKDEVVAMLGELKYELYQALCHEIHGKEDCPCTNQTTSCLATFRVCDADRAIGNVIQEKINALKGADNENVK